MNDYIINVPANVWSATIKSLAGNKCVICGSTDKLQAHHILPRSRYPEYANDLNNGICLCHECHYLYHNGKYNSTGNEWYGIKPPSMRYDEVRFFRDNCIFLILPHGTLDRINATGQPVNDFIVKAVLSQLDNVERSQGRMDDSPGE